MTLVRELPTADCTLDDLAREINAMHVCLHAVQREAQIDRKLAGEREALRRERHVSIKEDLGDIGRRLGAVERWQAAFAQSFGMRPLAEGGAPKRLLGLSYPTLLGWIVALVIGMATGPVGYFIFLRMLPAAVHGALSVAP